MTTFAVAALLLIMVPGPDQALITRNSLIGGPRGGVATMIGGVLGVIVHAGAAAAGLSAVLMASATAFTVLKVAGAAYLVWLGVQMLRSAGDEGNADSTDPALHRTAKRPGSSTYLRQGFLSNALNPKVVLFFVTFLPQFLSADTASPHGEALMFSAIFAALYVLWFGMYVAVVDRIGRVLRRPRVRARIERVTGAILCAVAIRLATTSH